MPWWNTFSITSTTCNMHMLYVIYIYARVHTIVYYFGDLQYNSKHTTCVDYYCNPSVSHLDHKNYGYSHYMLDNAVVVVVV